MILVDTSVWIDHLHQAEPGLQRALEADEVATHPLIIAELALGSIARRAEILALLTNLWRVPSLTHQEMLGYVEQAQLWGRGLSIVDAHLLGSVKLAPDSELWTRDKRLRTAARVAQVALFDEGNEQKG